MAKIEVAFAVVFTLIISSTAYSQELWTSKDGSIRNIDTRSIFIDGEKVYLATRSELYASSGPKAKWESIFFIPSQDNEINCISGSSSNLLVGTKRGLYRSIDMGNTWRNVFKTIMPDRNCVLAIDASRHSADKVVIGTARGIFLSDDGGARWRDISGVLKNHTARCIAIYGSYIYVGADDGLYMARYGAYDWERLYVYKNPTDTGEVSAEITDATEPEEQADPGVRCISIKGRKIYIASSGKILYSDDMGKGWKDISITGLGGNINYILVSMRSDRLYSATSKGVFEYMPDKKRWSELYRGIDKALNVNNITFGSADETRIWATADKGVYQIDIGAFAEENYIDVEKNLKTMKVVFDGEPSFKELQASAMKFNEVHPNKINEWRAQARMRALAPKVSVGFDNNKSNTYEIYTSATKDYVVPGPDDISEGFDLSVSWDLANLIWSDDQTNIDVRSRLTTQLRNDILDDLRRAYFERKRLQYEILSSPPVDAKLFYEKNLRIQELTQAIDDLTGNYLSTHTRSNIATSGVSMHEANHKS